MQYIKDISDITQQKRRQIKSLQDEFTTFSWGGVDAFENFGAFIINEAKGSLKFYNGPGFSNEYTKPQFDNAGGNLEGVTFNKQNISFKIGVYWISIEHYRKFLNWLSPLKIDYLQFGFAPNFRYDVKLSKISDSTRWIVGRENNEPRYYTELDLSFDIQGPPCAKGVYSYEFVSSNATNNKLWNFNVDTNTNQVLGLCSLSKAYDFTPSDLSTPVQVHFGLKLYNDNIEANYFSGTDEISVLGEYKRNSDEVVISKDASFDTDDLLKLNSIINTEPAEYEIKLYAQHSDSAARNPEKILLCDIVLQHLALFVERGYELDFTYVSETGLVFLQTNKTGFGDLLTLQTFTDSGEFLVKSLYSSKFMMPGAFEYEDFYNESHRVQFVLEYSKRTFNGSDWVSRIINKTCYDNQYISIECYPRTNII